MILEGRRKEVGELKWFVSMKCGKTAAREITVQGEGSETAVVQVTGHDAENWAHKPGEEIAVRFEPTDALSARVSSLTGIFSMRLRLLAGGKYYEIIS